MAKCLLLLFAIPVRAKQLDGEDSVTLLQTSFDVGRSLIHGDSGYSASTSPPSSNALSRIWQHTNGVAHNSSYSDVLAHMLDHAHLSQRDFIWPFVLFTGLHILYALLAFLYEMRTQVDARSCGAVKESGRCVEWDLLKLLFMFGVVLLHTGLMTHMVPLDTHNCFIVIAMPGFSLISGILDRAWTQLH
eukprot:TRINITY_DN3475_c0_g3_i2.p2 TRINITY_DN3475_c0_g3~~TRINITY_DN3475_c0_g3_i2.p2  ORF type:complete len:200 (-),score=6.97 TRINITY_DN3475_c0_g3_i2:1020-1586(-)